LIDYLETWYNFHFQIYENYGPLAWYDVETDDIIFGIGEQQSEDAISIILKPLDAKEYL
jgi:hypothetical protein